MILYIIVMSIFYIFCFRQCKTLQKSTTLYHLLHQMGKFTLCSGILMLIAFFWRMFLQQTPKILVIGSLLVYSIGLIYTMLKLHALQKDRKED